MYVGICYEGCATSESYTPQSVVWRKHSGDLFVHGVKLTKPKYSTAKALPSIGIQSSEETAGGFRAGDVVGVLVDVEQGRVAFYCNGVLARTVSGLQTSSPIYPFLSLGAPDVSAELVDVATEPSTPRDFTKREAPTAGGWLAKF